MEKTLGSEAGGFSIKEELVSDFSYISLFFISRSARHGRTKKGNKKKKKD